MNLYYFAHPYTVKNENGTVNLTGQEANFNLCCVRSVELIKLGFFVYSPIAHTHPMHIRDPEFLRTNEYKLWMDLDKELIDRTKFNGIILAPNWERSNGCRTEKEIFEGRGLEVLFYDKLIKEDQYARSK